MNNKKSKIKTCSGCGDLFYGHREECRLCIGNTPTLSIFKGEHMSKFNKTKFYQKEVLEIDTNQLWSEIDKLALFASDITLKQLDPEKFTKLQKEEIHGDIILGRPSTCVDSRYSHELYVKLRQVIVEYYPELINGLEV